MLPKKRPPTHPGEVLLEEFLQPFGLSQAQFSQRTRRLSQPQGIQQRTDQTAKKPRHPITAAQAYKIFFNKEIFSYTIHAFIISEATT